MIKFKIISALILFFMGQSFASDILKCENERINFITTQKKMIYSDKGKLQKTKYEEYPLMEDWSEASGEILALTIKGPMPIDKVKVSYWDKDKKQLLENEFKIEKNKIIKFDWSKMVKGKETRQGELRFQPVGKDQKILCQQNVNIHYADQLDR